MNFCAMPNINIQQNNPTTSEGFPLFKTRYKCQITDNIKNQFKIIIINKN